MHQEHSFVPKPERLTIRRASKILVKSRLGDLMWSRELGSSNDDRGFLDFDWLEYFGNRPACAD
jgi:hypothetical protein